MEPNALNRLKRVAGKQTTTLTHYRRKTGEGTKSRFVLMTISSTSAPRGAVLPFPGTVSRLRLPALGQVLKTPFRQENELSLNVIFSAQFPSRRQYVQGIR